MTAQLKNHCIGTGILLAKLLIMYFRTSIDNTYKGCSLIVRPQNGVLCREIFLVLQYALPIFLRLLGISNS